MDNTKIYENEEKCIAARNKSFIAYLNRRGLLTDPKLMDEALKQKRKEIAQKAYHNTELLLMNYRDIVWALETIPQQIASELQMPFATLDELVDRIDLEIGMDNRRLEGRLNSVTKSRLLIDRINEAVSVLRSKPRGGEDMYQIIHKTYMDPTFDGIVLAIIDELHLSKRRYYELKKQAIRLISLRLWSAPNIETEMWLDVLMMLENRSDRI